MPTPNSWISHVKAYAASHPGLTYGRALTLARQSYRAFTIPTESVVMRHHYTVDEGDTCSRIQVFIKPCTKDDMKCHVPYVGLPAPKPRSGKFSNSNYIYKAFGGQMFGANPTRIPPGFRLATKKERTDMDLSPSHVMKRFCTAPRDLERDLKEGVPADYLTAIANQKGYCLTIKDVSSMKPGTCKDVALLDRNWMDVACDAYERAKGGSGVVPANEFLSMNRVRLCRSEKKSLLEFTLTPHEGEGTFGSVPMRIELHVEYTPAHFYPLHKGVLSARNQQTGTPLLGKDVLWKKMPPHTRVGWRGPMMAWERVQDLEPLFCAP